MLNGDAHLSTRRDGELRIWPLSDYQTLNRAQHNRPRQVGSPFVRRLIQMGQFRYYKRTFLAPASSRTSSYIVAEVDERRRIIRAWDQHAYDRRLRSANPA